ncbi:hypothetical protein [Gordonia soli]|uniref:Mce-associated membrane protein n=1 Tax=Gordonia soli NBRC 108243 TaxID=1223545 RepID=M0QGM2_9ACTN|nr:hypothetical protein [Gordonia soli]GAC67775.1 hypothetical protein GS4_11_00430 [Gordonia soli NBRC 108243]
MNPLRGRRNGVRDGVGRWSTTRRRVWAAGLCVIVVALVVAVVAALGADRARPRPDDDTRRAILAAADASVTALMTFGPAEPPMQRQATARLLTGRLASDFATQGPDVVLPGAVAARASMTVTIVASGVGGFESARALVLVTADQQVRVPRPGVAVSESVERTPVARWATMSKVDGNWRLSDLSPVGDATR